MAILAHRCTRTRRRCKCIKGVRARRKMAHLDVLWRHSRKHTELAAEHMLVQTSLAKLCKRCLLRTGITCALSGASNIEQRLEQELQLPHAAKSLEIWSSCPDGVCVQHPLNKWQR